ncbi:MAG: histidine triad nucleotide-binding protein [Bacillota bacterium]|nr:histidine triad nucleotide-binding protein [Bacillota bacterium]
MQDCIFCKIVKGEIPASKVYEDQLILAFNDINPVAPKHILIIPKKHLSSLNAVTKADKELLGHIMTTAAKLADEFGIAANGYRIVNNCGNNGGQTVAHLHFHLIGGRSMQWPPG